MSNYELKHMFNFIEKINVDVLKLHTTKHCHKIKCKYVAANFNKLSVAYLDQDEMEEILQYVPDGYEFTIEWNFNDGSIGFMRGSDHSQYIGQGILKNDPDFYDAMETSFVFFFQYGENDIDEQGDGQYH